MFIERTYPFEAPCAVGSMGPGAPMSVPDIAVNRGALP